jgi:hypothetical protein
MNVACISIWISWMNCGLGRISVGNTSLHRMNVRVPSTSSIIWERVHKLSQSLISWHGTNGHSCRIPWRGHLVKCHQTSLFRRQYYSQRRRRQYYSRIQKQAHQQFTLPRGSNLMQLQELLLLFLVLLRQLVLQFMWGLWLFLLWLLIIVTPPWTMIARVTIKDCEIKSRPKRQWQWRQCLVT